MERTYYIIIPQFISIDIALRYLNENSLSFNFYVAGKIYNSQRTEVQKPINAEIIPINKLAIQIFEFSEYLSPGQTYIQDGFIQYFKELKS